MGFVPILKMFLYFDNLTLFPIILIFCLSYRNVYDLLRCFQIPDARCGHYNAKKSKTTRRYGNFLRVAVEDSHFKLL
jgi:hypothetical protein